MVNPFFFIFFRNYIFFLLCTLRNFLFICFPCIDYSFSPCLHVFPSSVFFLPHNPFHLYTFPAFCIYLTSTPFTRACCGRCCRAKFYPCLTTKLIIHGTYSVFSLISVTSCIDKGLEEKSNQTVEGLVEREQVVRQKIEMQLENPFIHFPLRKCGCSDLW